VCGAAGRCQLPRSAWLRLWLPGGRACGAGKTRLGLQVAAELLDGDGVWLAELTAVTDQDAVAVAVDGTLRIPAQPGRPATPHHPPTRPPGPI